MTIKLRWKKEPKETGLGAVGRDPVKRGSFLHDGKETYASVYCLSYFALSKGDGWYWVASSDSDVPYYNSCKTPVEDEATAKARAMASWGLSESQFFGGLSLAINISFSTASS